MGLPDSSANTTMVAEIKTKIKKVCEPHYPLVLYIFRMLRVIAFQIRVTLEFFVILVGQ
jgi:hypothetical protein